MAIIYHRTEKGALEIATRACKIGTWERTLLLKVDGQTPLEELMAKSKFFTTEAVNYLVSLGLIESKTGGKAAVAGAGATAKASKPVVANETTMFKDLRRYVSNSLVDALGPGVMDIAGKFESVADLKEFDSLLAKYENVINTMPSKKRTAFKAGLESKRNLVAG